MRKIVQKCENTQKNTEKKRKKMITKHEKLPTMKEELQQCTEI